MWKPQKEGMEELINLFESSKSNNNTVHQEIYNKINDYSKHNEFSNYLVYILNSEENPTEIRQIAGLSLKGIMERSFASLTESTLEYFKGHILECYLDKNPSIRRTISNLINTFLRHGGMEMWPEILEFLVKHLDTSMGVEMTLETLNIIIEDSGNYLEENCSKFLQELIPKILNFLNEMGKRAKEERSDDLIILVLHTFNILLENCSSIMHDQLDNAISILVHLHISNNFEMRYQIGRCWLTMVRMNKEIVLDHSSDLFSFFTNNLTAEHYKMNFIAAEFFLFLVEEEDELMNQEKIKEKMFYHFETIVKSSLHYMKLTMNDISGLDNKFNKSGTSNNSRLENFVDEENEGDLDEDEFTEGYNTNWTLRKCCSKFIDKLSNIYPEHVFEIIRPILEKDIQHSDWLIKERSILCLGAIGVGSYPYLKPHLSNLISFLIKELEHPNKLVRAISCWTLSRFTKFILTDNLSDNAYQLFKDYLCETLKKFLDSEIIVQDAACTSFTSMVLTNKDKLEPYLFDIFKIITSVFNKYTGTSLLTLYEIITLLTENFEDHFKNIELIGELVSCVVKRWYDMVKSEDLKNLCPVFEILCAIVKASGELMQEYFNHFLAGSIWILESNYKNYKANKYDINFLDKELLSKSIDMISILCHQFPSKLRLHQSKHKILEYILKFIETNDNFLKHYLIALLGDLSKADDSILKNQFQSVMNIVIINMEIPDNTKLETIEIERMSVCNNSCWTAGLLALNYPLQTEGYVADIMNKIMKILSLPKLNKSLAQNVCICIGRLALAEPQAIAKHLDSVLKQFCLSLRYINDSVEKQEAFNGLCKAIIQNPTGVMNYFAFFCDAICQYDNAPEDLENLFQHLIKSYKSTLKEKWMDFFKLFPEKLKTKMTVRFRL